MKQLFTISIFLVALGILGVSTGVYGNETSATDVEMFAFDKAAVEVSVEVAALPYYGDRFADLGGYSIDSKVSGEYLPNDTGQAIAGHLKIHYHSWYQGVN